MIALVLAGGHASRLGGVDKGLLAIGGVSILERVVAALAPQCQTLLLNANGDPARLTGFGLPVLPDIVPGRPGPLAGLLTGMEHVAAADPSAEAILTVPGDVPFLPLDLASRLAGRRAAENAAVVRARSGERTHGVVALWSLALRIDLRRALVDEGVRKVGVFAARHAVATETWPVEPFDPFLNVNTPEDLAHARLVAERFSVL